LTINPLQARERGQWLTTLVYHYENPFGLTVQRWVLLLVLTEIKNT